MRCPDSILEAIIVEFSPTMVTILSSECNSNNSVIAVGLNSLDVLSMVNPSGSSSAAEIMHSLSTKSEMILIPTNSLSNWHFNTIWMKSLLSLRNRFQTDSTLQEQKLSLSLFFYRIQSQIDYPLSLLIVSLCDHHQ